MKKNKSKIWEICSYILIIVVVLIIKFYVVSPIKVNGSSMNDTLLDGDIMLLNEIVYRFNDIKRFDIVVSKSDKELLIKRVIGLPGEKIRCTDGIIYINDSVLVKDYGSNKTDDFDEVTIGNDEYFLMGDNRDNSLDSRYFGTFNKNKIKGRTKYTLFPFNRFGLKK